jgi:rhodanese-related sulfurtransferase
MAGFMIENLLTGTVKQFHWSDVAGLPKDGGMLLLDTRTKAEHARGSIDGALHIPLDELRERVNELDPAKPVYVFCHSGLRSYLACRILSQNGFECYNLSGGYSFYATIMKDKCFDGVPAHACGIKI